LTVVGSNDAGKEKVCVYALLSSLVVSVIVYRMLLIYQQDKNDYNNKKNTVSTIFDGKRQLNEVSIDQKSAVENNQPAQEPNNQETKG
jgi:hypothetical protein